MNGLAELAGRALDLCLVIIGFGLIIFVHELGHFLAAKWAGIRVLAFAIGFGPAAVSYRKGLGLRRGSSEQEHQQLLKREAAGVTTHEGTRSIAPSDMSPTEYRLNWLPFGGYVKMLGQEDIGPATVNDAPDSYQRTPVWKRMIVISAGVVFNIIAAALLFIAVFMHGLKTEPPVVGWVAPGSPASRAAPVDGSVGIGLRPGDRVIRVNDRKAQSFNDLVMTSAMSRRGESMTVVVAREGIPGTIEFKARPEPGTQSRLLEIGVAPPWTARIDSPKPPEDRELLVRMLEHDGLAGVEPGMTLASIDGRPVTHGAADLLDAARKSGGEPLTLVFRSDDGRTVSKTITPRPELQTAKVPMPSGAVAAFDHLAGLAPIMKVEDSAARGVEPKQGLKAGDLFARIGSVDYPSLAAGIAEIHQHRGEQIEVVVLRPGADGRLRKVTIDPPPTVQKIDQGQIGFIGGEAVETNIVARPPEVLLDDSGANPRSPPAASAITRPGVRIAAVNGKPVHDFAEIRTALRDATASALTKGAGTRVTLRLDPPPGEEDAGTGGEASLPLGPDDIRALHNLAWTSPIELAIFEPEEFTLVAKGPLDAIDMGMSETKRVMLMTYATFQRLFEGTVKVEHLKGPVGIAHMGTNIAKRGIVWLLFFMALISVNLAVVNFLPLPIVDGGQFVFLILEQIRGRPLSVQVQNIATIAGLVLIGTMFVIVTFQDIRNLFG